MLNMSQDNILPERDTRIPKITKKIPQFEKIHEKLLEKQELLKRSKTTQCIPFEAGQKVIRNFSRRFLALPEMSPEPVNTTDFPELQTKIKQHVSEIRLPGAEEIDLKVKIHKAKQNLSSLM